MLSRNDLKLYLLRHPSMKGPLLITPHLISIEWIDPVILPEEILKIQKDTDYPMVSFTYLNSKLLVVFA
jgi:hypothetical protein